MKTATLLACAAALALGACNDAQDGVPPTSENAAQAAGDRSLATGLGDNARFAAAVKAAGLEGVLAGPTPYTLIVPSDAAFDKLPAGTLDTLMKPRGRAQLTAVLTNHVLPGTMMAADIARAIETGGGRTQIATLGGGTLTATRDGDVIVLRDAAGTRARVTSADGARSNGVIHVIDAVLLPAE